MPAPAASCSPPRSTSAASFSSGSSLNLVRRLLAAVLPLFGLSEPSAAAAGARLRASWPSPGSWSRSCWWPGPCAPGPTPGRGWPPSSWPTCCSPRGSSTGTRCRCWASAAVPWSLTSLVAVALSITLVPLAPAGPPAVGAGAAASAGDLVDTLAGFASRYGGALLVLWLGLRDRRLTGPGGRLRPAARSSRHSSTARSRAWRKCSKKRRVSSSRSPAGEPGPTALTPSDRSCSQRATISSRRVTASYQVSEEMR